MKTTTVRLVIVAVLFAVCSFSSAGATGNKNNEFEITPIENLFLGKSIEKIWTINYSEEKKPVTITLRIVDTGRQYIVRSKYLEVVYAMDREGFGVRKMDPSISAVPELFTKQVFDKKQMKAQRVLTKTQVSDDTALELIANNLPDLINERYLNLIY